MLVWIDLETTGLSPTNDKVLEVACIVTNHALEEVARFSMVTSEAATAHFGALDPVVQRMHVENGLWLESAQSSRSLVDVRAALGIFLDSHLRTSGTGVYVGDNTWIPPEYVRPVLAGSTVSFDRAFLEVHMPRAAAMLHYRNLDVTSINELAKRFWPDAFEARPRQDESRPDKHRAMPDIESSLDVARYYARTLGPVSPGALDVLEEVVDADIAALPDAVREARLRCECPETLAARAETLVLELIQRCGPRRNGFIVGALAPLNYRVVEDAIYNLVRAGLLMITHDSYLQETDMTIKKKATPKNAVPQGSGKTTFLAAVETEYRDATEAHGLFSSAHEGYAVLLEEVDELWDEVKKKRASRSRRGMYDECVQVAAMAMKFALAFGEARS